MSDLIVRNRKTKEEVHRVSVDAPFSPSRGMYRYERVMMGMLINMGDDYYIDDSEFDNHPDEPKE